MDWGPGYGIGTGDRYCKLELRIAIGDINQSCKLEFGNGIGD